MMLRKSEQRAFGTKTASPEAAWGDFLALDKAELFRVDGACEVHFKG
jgi:hypothetical protein